MSSASSVNDALAGYLAGRVSAQYVVSVVAAEYYRDAGSGMRDALKPLMDIIERAPPGVVELVGSGERPGFNVQLAERPFPKRYEQELRQAVQAIATPPPSPMPRPSLWARIVRAIQRVFRD
jgi:hypothetical protein